MAQLIKDAARDDAAKVLTENWTGNSFPVDPVAIANTMGLKVFTAELPQNQSGMIVKENNIAEIYLNRYQPRTRRSFTCAHEIGHYVDRQQRNDNKYSFVDYRMGEQNVFEWYADHFAENLLMPEGEFKKQLGAGRDVSRLSEYFGVSPAAVSTRLRHLKL